MKKAVLIFPLLIIIILNILAVSANAVTDDTKKEVGYEYLSGTETASEFNKYKNKLRSYFNSKIQEQQKDLHVKVIKEALDFNNDKQIKGVKVYNDCKNYDTGILYDDMKKTLSDNGYVWKILITNENAAVYAVIEPCDGKNNSDDHFHFGDNWCVTKCEVGNTDPKSMHNISGYFSLYGMAETNINALIDTKKYNDVKVLYTNFGDQSSDTRDYSDCGIIFIDGKAKYIYTHSLYLDTDNLKKVTPVSVKEILEYYSSEFYNNRVYSKTSADTGKVKKLFDYDLCMSMIKLYEEYAA